MKKVLPIVLLGCTMLAACEEKSVFVKSCIKECIPECMAEGVSESACQNVCKCSCKKIEQGASIEETMKCLLKYSK